MRTDQKGNARNRLITRKIPSIHLRTPRENTKRPQAITIHLTEASRVCTKTATGYNDDEVNCGP